MINIMMRDACPRNTRRGRNATTHASQGMMTRQTPSARHTRTHTHAHGWLTRKASCSKRQNVDTASSTVKKSTPLPNSKKHTYIYKTHNQPKHDMPNQRTPHHTVAGQAHTTDSMAWLTHATSSATFVDSLHAHADISSCSSAYNK